MRTPPTSPARARRVSPPRTRASAPEAPAAPSRQTRTQPTKRVRARPAKPRRTPASGRPFPKGDLRSNVCAGRPRKPASPEPRECPAPPSDTEWADRRQHGLGMFPPNLGLDVDVDLDLVCRLLLEKNNVSDVVVGQANNVGNSRRAIGYFLSHLLVGG